MRWICNCLRWSDGWLEGTGQACADRTMDSNLGYAVLVGTAHINLKKAIERRPVVFQRLGPSERRSGQMADRSASPAGSSGSSIIEKLKNWRSKLSVAPLRQSHWRLRGASLVL